jgi:hypothetical protein
MPERRVVVFVDYQNAYREARRSFFDDRNDPFTVGQFDPVGLAELVTARATDCFPGDPRTLTQVRIYSGLPDAVKEPKGYAATSRQIGKWGADPRVRVFARPLRYPGGWPKDPPRQKGVDIWLAIHYLAMALRGEYDVGVLVSRDTDMLPAIEEVQMVGSHVGCEVTTWAPKTVTPGRLRTEGRPLWCHYITRDAFQHIEDRRDYNTSL